LEVQVAGIYELFPPLWEDCDAYVSEGFRVEPDWDLAGQPTPDYEVDQRVNW
jgi:hypothetical protein